MQCDRCGAKLNEVEKKCHACGHTIDVIPEDLDHDNPVERLRNEVLAEDAAGKFSFIGNGGGKVKTRKYFSSRACVLLITAGCIVVSCIVALGIYWHAHSRQKSVVSTNVISDDTEKPALAMDVGKKPTAREKAIPQHRSKKRKKPERVVEATRKNYVPPSMPPAEITETKQNRTHEASESLIDQILNRPTARGTPLSRDPRETGL